jgi:hypothetical protein
MRDHEVVEITIDCKLGDMVRAREGQYVLRWIGGEEKIISAPTFKFATQNMPTALNDVAVLCALNPCIRAINIKKWR